MDLSKFIILDIETIGLQQETGKIIEIAAIEVENWKIIGEYDQLINPEVGIPKITRDLTGIHDKDLVGKPLFSEIAGDFLKFVGNLPLVGHNIISFDKPYIDYNLGLIGLSNLVNPILDTMELSIFLKPELKKFKLGYLYNNLLNKKVDQKHRAIDDCKQVHELLLVLRKVRDEEWDKNWLDHIGHIAKRENWSWADFILDSRSMNLGPKINSYLPVENYIVDNVKKEIREEFNEEEIINKNIDLSSVKYYFDEEKAHLKKVLGGNKYEYRKQQEEMALKIADSINNNKYLVVEAPTGCGKSLAYLIPSIIWSLENNNRPIVVSTFTNVLQDQLYENDFFMLNKIFTTAKMTVVKGREHYICIRKLKKYFEDNSDAGQLMMGSRYSERLTSIFIANWVTKNVSNNCDFDRFSGWFKNHIKDFKTTDICSDSDSCQRKYCRFHKKCFIDKLQSSAQNSNIVITNHSLLFSNSSVLPITNYLIFDEAINIEEAVTDASTTTFSSRELNLFLGELEGLFGRVSSFLAKNKDKTNVDNIVSRIEKIKIDSVELFNDIKSDIGNVELKYDKKIEINESFLQRVKDCLENIRLNFHEVSSFLNHILDKYFSETRDDFYQSIFNYGKKAEEYASFLNALLELDKDKYIYYKLIGSKSSDLSLNICYKNVGEFLQNNLYNNPDLKSIIFTSATLSYNNNFDFINQIWGLDLLDKDKCDYLKLDHLFDYEKQCILFLINDLPRKNFEEPRWNSQNYYPINSDFVKNILISNNGSGLVIFTSKEDVEMFSNLIIDDFENNNIPLYSAAKSNDNRIYCASNSSLAEEFRDNIESCLFGTAGFREGIDVPGSSLEIVILVKMPFSYPYDPITQNRRDIYGDFEGYTMPHCIFNLKQAFGRLIRSKKDNGFVFLIDSKVKKYYNTIVSNFPPKLLVRYASVKESSDLNKIISNTKYKNDRIKKVLNCLEEKDK